MSSRQSNADRQACKRTAKHLCLPQRSFLSYNWLFCPACGFGFKTPALRARAPFISPQNTEDDGRCFPRWATKWLPLSKGRGCTWLMDSCVSCEIARHLERPDRKKGQETRGERWGKEKTERSRLDSMPEQGPSALSDFKCPLCEIVVSNTNNLTAFPMLHPLILLSSSAYHEMCRLALSQNML